mmetsp:Transcript_12907/g.35737  ORF Transcript_12907/g.35737 Transcript_12907/m.35737 type:complete len:384 (-) Transcript_12907:957-2108(-)
MHLEWCGPGCLPAHFRGSVGRAERPWTASCRGRFSLAREAVARAAGEGRQLTHLGILCGDPAHELGVRPLQEGLPSLGRHRRRAVGQEQRPQPLHGNAEHTRVLLHDLRGHEGPREASRELHDAQHPPVHKLPLPESKANLDECVALLEVQVPGVHGLHVIARKLHDAGHGPGHKEVHAAGILALNAELRAPLKAFKQLPGRLQGGAELLLFLAKLRFEHAAHGRAGADPQGVARPEARGRQQQLVLGILQRRVNIGEVQERGGTVFLVPVAAWRVGAYKPKLLVLVTLHRPRVREGEAQAPDHATEEDLGREGIGEVEQGEHAGCVDRWHARHVQDHIADNLALELLLKLLDDARGRAKEEVSLQPEDPHLLPGVHQMLPLG